MPQLMLHIPWEVKVQLKMPNIIGIKTFAFVV